MKPGSPIADRYLELVGRFPLRPIHDDAALEAATAMIDELLRLPGLSPEEDDYLDVLGDLVEKYEEQAHPIPEAPARDVPHYLMDCRGLEENALAKDLGIPLVELSEVLASARIPTPLEITELAKYFGLRADVFH